MWKGTQQADAELRSNAVSSYTELLDLPKISDVLLKVSSPCFYLPTKTKLYPSALYNCISVRARQMQGYFCEWSCATEDTLTVIRCIC
jgi:hypothetical protein